MMKLYNMRSGKVQRVRSIAVESGAVCFTLLMSISDATLFRDYNLYSVI